MTRLNSCKPDAHSDTLFKRLGPITYRRPDDLAAYKRNARKHPERQLVALAASIQQFGFNVPVLIDGTGEIIAGHARVEAAKRLGLSEVPTISATHMSPAQVKAGVPRMLDTLCDRILNPTPRNRQTPITTARAIAQQLNAVLGQASAAPDLERRLRMPIEPIRTTAGRLPAAAPTAALAGRPRSAHPCRDRCRPPGATTTTKPARPPSPGSSPACATTRSSRSRRCRRRPGRRSRSSWCRRRSAGVWAVRHAQ